MTRTKLETFCKNMFLPVYNLAQEGVWGRQVLGAPFLDMPMHGTLKSV